MSRFAYVNGRFVRHGEAAVHIEDRGYQLADGVYEVWAVFDGKLADAEGHFARLWRSLDELRIAHPMTEAALTMVLREAVRRNKVRDGLCYLQVTRGVARRDHAFPNPPVLPSVVVTAKSIDRAATEAKAAQGASVISVPENRWGRCDIKTVGLLPNCFAKQAARENGAYETIFYDDKNVVTEGSSSNAWIVTEGGALVTRAPSNEILNGVTRLELIKLAAAEGLKFEERSFTMDELRRAREVFVTSASSFVMPVTQVDDKTVANGKPGAVATKLRAALMAHMDKQVAAAQA